MTLDLELIMQKTRKCDYENLKYPIIRQKKNAVVLNLSLNWFDIPNQLKLNNTEYNKISNVYNQNTCRL